MNNPTVQLDWFRLLGFDQTHIDRFSTRSLGRNLVAKVGQKETVRSGVCLPLSVTAKIGKKEN